MLQQGWRRCWPTAWGLWSLLLGHWEFPQNKPGLDWTLTYPHRASPTGSINEFVTRKGVSSWLSPWQHPERKSVHPHYSDQWKWRRPVFQNSVHTECQTLLCSLGRPKKIRVESMCSCSLQLVGPRKREVWGFLPPQPGPIPLESPSWLRCNEGSTVCLDQETCECLSGTLSVQTQLFLKSWLQKNNERDNNDGMHRRPVSKEMLMSYLRDVFFSDSW